MLRDGKTSPTFIERNFDNATDFVVENGGGCCFFVPPPSFNILAPVSYCMVKVEIRYYS
jgi:hypothetical protein